MSDRAFFVVPVVRPACVAGQAGLAPSLGGAEKIGTSLLAALALLLFFLSSAFAIDFPALTDRVVDQAGIIPAGERTSLDQSLKALEDKSSDQLVVVTLKSLEGLEIADYGYQLGRHWGIGQGKLSNGVLLIVAPNERKVRIEVGYGLEGTLTDALSSVVIQQAILPKFKAGDMPAGIKAGVAAIEDVLLNNESEWKQRARDGARSDESFDPQTVFVILFILFFVFVIASGWIDSSRGGPRGPGARRRGSGPVFIPTSSGWGGGSSWGGGGGSSGGGFSGGGGSFGGGGSSGSW